jgi:hypothetical protein
MEVSIGITIGKFRDNSDHNPIKTHEWHYFYYHYLSIYSNITGKPLLLPVPTSTIRTSKKTVFCGTKCTCPGSWLSSCNPQLSNLCVECYTTIHIIIIINYNNIIINTIIIIIIIIITKIPSNIKFNGGGDLMIP